MHLQMFKKHLKLNTCKTQLPFLPPKLAYCTVFTAGNSSSIIEGAQTKDPGILLTCLFLSLFFFLFFSIISHIQPIRKSCCLYLQNITKMQRLLTTSPFLACSETSSSLNYCIGLLTNLSFLPPKCHSPSPILARVMILKWKTDHLMSVLKTPCWLPISFKVKAKPLRVVPKLHVICTHTHRHPLPPSPTCSLPLLVVFFLSLLDTKQKLA